MTKDSTKILDGMQSEYEQAMADAGFPVTSVGPVLDIIEADVRQARDIERLLAVRKIFARRGRQDVLAKIEKILVLQYGILEDSRLLDREH